ncbi:hypothetical protein MRX96_014178 [Rhipicephalus microplus]
MTMARPGMHRCTVKVRNTTYDNKKAGVAATGRPMRLSAGGRPMQPRQDKLEYPDRVAQTRRQSRIHRCARWHARGGVSESDRKRTLINRPRGPMRRGGHRRRREGCAWREPARQPTSQPTDTPLSNIRPHHCTPHSAPVLFGTCRTPSPSAPSKGGDQAGG